MEEERFEDQVPPTPPLKPMRRLGMMAAGAVLAGLVLLYGAYRSALAGLPKLDTATDYRPFIPSVVIDIQGRIAAEYGEQRRIVVPYTAFPKHVIQAFLAAEDATFFEHGGVDLVAILRAAVKNFTSGKVRQGASTITQQVAKTFFLSPERTIVRKLREIALSWKLEQALTKEEILYLYLNQIYFGQGAYGVESAANVYFGKHITDVTVAEAAILAGLPKAPSAYSPYDNPTRARQRQLYVIDNMLENGYLGKPAADAARSEAVAIRRWQNPAVKGGYYAEQVRRYLVEAYGEERVLQDGLRAETGMDLDLQVLAQKSVQKGVLDLEKRHGYRGPVSHVTEAGRAKLLESIEREVHEAEPGGVIRIIGPDVDAKKEPPHADTPPARPVRALVESVEADRAVLAVGKHKAVLPLFDTTWAVKFDLQSLQSQWNPLRTFKKTLKPGDVILVEVTDPAALAKGTPSEKSRLEQWKKLKVESGVWWATLRPAPLVQSALLTTDPKTAEIRAMVGGYDFFESQYNRAMQARRQPGSAFKPILYAAALAQGYNPATMVVDSPDVYENAAEDSTAVTYWKPKNFDEEFLGPITLRYAFVLSRNVPALRIAQDIGIEALLTMAAKLGVTTPLERNFSIALGSNGMSLYELANVYTVFDAGGMRRDLKLVRRVLDREGKVLEQQVPDFVIAGREPTPEERATADETYYHAEQALDPQINYLMVWLLGQVVQHGTGMRAQIGRPAAGKTGTTNDNVDSWFMGFTPEYVTGVWIGIDQADQNLGSKETGGEAAAPIWSEFMRKALKGKPVQDFTVPDKIVMKDIDGRTGLLAGPFSEKVTKMPFVYGTEPSTSTDAEVRPGEDELLKLDMGL